MNNKIRFLSNLNKSLALIEKEIIERATICLETGAKKVKDKDEFTTDYMVEAMVEYYIKNEDDPSHIFWKIFNYETIIVDKDYGMFLDNGNNTDWHRQGTMPLLDQPYCYLLHDVFEHFGDGLYDLERIWVDVVFKDQKGLKIKKDGSSRMLELNEKNKGYE